MEANQTPSVSQAGVYGSPVADRGAEQAEQKGLQKVSKWKHLGHDAQSLLQGTAPPGPPDARKPDAHSYALLDRLTDAFNWSWITATFFPRGTCLGDL